MQNDPPAKLWPGAKVMVPLLLIFRPVSAAAAGATPNSRFNVAEANDVLLFTGSACQWKTWFAAVPVPLLNAEATMPNGLEMAPAIAVAVADAGRFSSPRMVVLPFTSNAACGVVE